MHFADRLITRVRELGQPLCLGLDPHLALIPPLFRRGGMDRREAATATAVEEFLLAVLERYAGKVAVVKPQSAFFEQLGWRGVAVLDRLIGRARELGLLVLLDAKRGDIDSTAEAYTAYLDPQAPLNADALTVNPYLGCDTLQPFVERCRMHERGIFVLVKTSNPGSRDYQDQLVGSAPLYEVVAQSLAPHSLGLRGKTGWSSLGVVVGATHPAQSQRVRELLPHALFLVPGYGAQGGGAADAVAGFVAGPRGREGGVVNSSRGLLFPKDPAGDSASAWERAIDAARDRAIAELGDAVRGA